MARGRQGCKGHGRKGSSDARRNCAAGSLRGGGEGRWEVPHDREESGLCKY